METATKKKRGRPAQFTALDYEILSCRSNRAAQNLYYAAVLAQRILKQRQGDFFITESGYYRRQGIAEKIGRMYTDGLINEEEARDLAQQAIDLYNNGKTVKQIETILSLFRKDLERGN